MVLQIPICSSATIELILISNYQPLNLLETLSKYLLPFDKKRATTKFKTSLIQIIG